MLTKEVGTNIGMDQLRLEPFAEAAIHIHALDIPKIHTILSKELENLKEQSDKLADKIENLYRPQHCFSTLNTPLRNLALVITTLKITTMIGIFLTATETHNSTLQWSGVALVIFSTWFEGGLNFYQQKLSLRQKQILELVAQNRYEIIQGQKYKEFAEKLEMTTKLLSQQQIEEVNDTYPNQVSTEEKLHRLQRMPSLPFLGNLVDNQISGCLHTYESLPLTSRREETFCRIVSELIKRLPSTDPVAQAFRELSPEANQEDLGELAGKPLSNRYLVSSNSMGKNVEYWNSESQPNLKKEESDKILEIRRGSQNFIFDTNREKLQKLAAHLNEQVKKRFNLKRDIPYFETVEGWRVSSQEGAYQINLSKGEFLEPSGSNKIDPMIQNPTDSV